MRTETTAMSHRQPPPMPGIRWRKLIDALFDARLGYDRMRQVSGIQRHELDRIIDGDTPTASEKRQLAYLASHYVSVRDLQAMGFQPEDLDRMCLLQESGGKGPPKMITEEPVRAFSQAR